MLDKSGDECGFAENRTLEILKPVFKVEHGKIGRNKAMESDMDSGGYLNGPWWSWNRFLAG